MLLPVALQPRALGDDNSHSFSASTWIPVAVAVAVLVFLTLLVCSRKSIRTRVINMGTGVAVASGMPIARELTAEQLAGTINRAPDAAPRRARRTPRRTPSQISTVSLPAYMKEPGEQELVVTRGPDGEDVVMPAASAVEDDDDESHEDHQPNGQNQSTEQRNSRYEPMPHSPHDSPLLALDPRGDAPAYYEVVEPPAEHYPPPGISVDLPEAEAQPTQQRRSGFFSLFRPAPTLPPAPAENDPNRLSLHHTRTRSTTNASGTPTRHRASTSTSTLFSLTRTRSNTSVNNLTSPSLISLASISHPLPHTLVKTEFSALPKNGLTPEQLSLISGTKEGGLSRFGVPWGAAAVAYANASASTSRLAVNEDGEAPPPRWEEVPGQGEASGADAAHAEGETVSGTAAAAEETEASTAQPPAAEPTTPSRADSRASGVSTQSFATADEGESDNDESHGIPHIHVQEPTDATVRP